MKKHTLTLVAIVSAVITSCSKTEPETPSAQSPEIKAYPLTTCVVSGEELGSMGDPIEYDHNGTTVKFCCKNCIKDFEADPEKFLAKLN